MRHSGGPQMTGSTVGREPTACRGNVVARGNGVARGREPVVARGNGVAACRGREPVVARGNVVARGREPVVARGNGVARGGAERTVLVGCTGATVTVGPWREARFLPQLHILLWSKQKRGTTIPYRRAKEV